MRKNSLIKFINREYETLTQDFANFVWIIILAAGVHLALFEYNTKLSLLIGIVLLYLLWTSFQKIEGTLFGALSILALISVYYFKLITPTVYFGFAFLVLLFIFKIISVIKK